MSPHYSWINFTGMIAKIKDEDYFKTGKIENNIKPLGTGFIIFSNDKPFLITARHVIQNEEYTLANLPCIFDYTFDSASGIRREIINLSNIQKENGFKWIFHEDDERIENQGNNYLIDIAITQLVVSKEFTEALYWGRNDSNFIADFMDTTIGNDIRIIGFPLAFVSSGDYTPTIRRRIIARKIHGKTIFKNKFFPRLSYLIDCFIDNGNSGSPVIKIPIDSTLRTSTKPDWDPNTEGLIGVATGHFGTERAHAGLGICISVDYIYDIIKSIENK